MLVYQCWRVAVTFSSVGLLGVRRVVGGCSDGRGGSGSIVFKSLIGGILVWRQAASVDAGYGGGRGGGGGASEPDAWCLYF